MSDPQQRPGRLGVGVVGAGRVGAVLGSALRAAGHAVLGASGDSEETRERIEVLLPGVPVLGVEEVVERSELVLFAVPDDVLAPLVEGLAALGRFSAGQLVVHTAGRYGTEVLEPARAAGAIPLAIHPAMTFTGTSIDLSRLVGAPFAVTAPAPVLPIAQALVVEIGGEPVVLPEGARGLYHAALAHGANHLVTLVAQAERLLAVGGVADGGTLLRPLLTAALDGALRGGDHAVTGPVSRGDVGTVADHLAHLAQAGPEVADVPPTYRALARATAARAVATGRLDPARARTVLDVLSRTDTESDPAPALRELAVVHTRADLELALAAPHARRAVVMTMGALHEGHLELVRTARTLADQVVVTVFVNPLQFGPAEDFEAYPRTLEADVAALRAQGAADVVFAPAPQEMYPGGEPEVRVSAGRMGTVLEGAVRPGHFDGMLTVVHKLLSLTAPDVALFGQKDAQQLALIRRMVADLNLPVEIVAVPIVRERDGLARSSRNVYLSETERTAALVLSRAVLAGAAAADGGPGAVLAAAEAQLAGAAGVDVDYVALVDPATMEPVGTNPPAAALLAVAARVGPTRLIDNTVVTFTAGGEEE